MNGHASSGWRGRTTWWWRLLLFLLCTVLFEEQQRVRCSADLERGREHMAQREQREQRKQRKQREQREQREQRIVEVSPVGLSGCIVPTCQRHTVSKDLKRPHHGVQTVAFLKGGQHGRVQGRTQRVSSDAHHDVPPAATNTLGNTLGVGVGRDRQTIVGRVDAQTPGLHRRGGRRPLHVEQDAWGLLGVVVAVAVVVFVVVVLVLLLLLVVVVVNIVVAVVDVIVGIVVDAEIVEVVEVVEVAVVDVVATVVVLYSRFPCCYCC